MARRKGNFWPLAIGYVVGSFFGLAHVKALVGSK